MAVYGLSLNALLDGAVQTTLIRFTVDDSVIPDFLAFYRKRFTATRPGLGPPPPSMTDIAVFKQWARMVIAQMQSEVRGAAEQKAASDAIGALPPPVTPIET